MMRHHSFFELALYSSLLLLSGCSLITRDYGFLPDGDTKTPETYNDVLATYGAPDSIAVMNSTTIFVYHSVRITEPQIGLSSRAFTWLKFSLGKATAEHHMKLFSFDKNYNVTESVEKYWNNELGKGTALEIVLSLGETVDVSRYEKIKKSLLWGKQLLLSPTISEHDEKPLMEGKRLDTLGQIF